MKPRPLHQRRPEALIALEGSHGDTCVSRAPSWSVFVTTTVLDRAAGTAVDSQEEGVCTPAACRIGLLGLGNIGSAFARLSRDAAAPLARQRGTAHRYEAACIAGVPFVGTFERRALGARASGVTAILNGTSNYILTTMTRGGSFEAALADAQRLGYAEPDPTMDVSGA